MEEKKLATKPAAKKETVKKETAVKPAAKKETVKKETAAKTVVKKETVKKTAVKKEPVEKVAMVKKPAVKKETAAKTAAKKTTIKDEAVQAVAAAPKAKRAVKKADKSIVSSEPSKKVSYENPEALSQWILKLIDEKKGINIIAININAKTVIADYFVIASATSSTAVRAITDYVDEKLSKDFGIEPLRRDIDAKWTAVDYGSVIVHIFDEETREFYQLERLWSDGTNVTTYKGNN